MATTVHCFWLRDFSKSKSEFFPEFLFISKRSLNAGERAFVLMYSRNISRRCGEFRVGYVEI